MSLPKIIISGDVLRPGQDGNIAFLWAALADMVQHVFGVAPSLVRGTPLSWEEWKQARVHGPSRYSEAWGGADLIIGFELPPAARTAAKHCIDIRRHPCRFDAGQAPFSFTASFPSILASGLIEPIALRVPAVSVTPWCTLDVAITLQMHADASLLHGSELLQPEALVPEFEALVRHASTVWLVPHPNEPRNTWLDVLSGNLPRTRVWQGTAYEAMASMPRMVTVSSSTGFEAPFFGCSPKFLRQPEAPSAPYNLRSDMLWTELAAAYYEARDYEYTRTTQPPTLSETQPAPL